VSDQRHTWKALSPSGEVDGIGRNGPEEPGSGIFHPVMAGVSDDKEMKRRHRVKRGGLRGFISAETADSPPGYEARTRGHTPDRRLARG
jgi:hypothetical protein